MPYQLAPFADIGLTPGALDALLRHHEQERLPRLRLFWEYWRNAMHAPQGGGAGARGGALGYRLAQQRGLPERLLGTGMVGGAQPSALGPRAAPAAEVVVENDIGWRVQTMVDYLFGKPVRLQSLAGTAPKRAQIERVLNAVWEASGGMTLLQDAALLGHVYGHVDLLVRVIEGAPDIDGAADEAARAAGTVRVEVVEPTRAVPLQGPADYRVLDAFIVRYERAGVSGGPPVTVTEVHGAHAWQVYAQEQAQTAGEPGRGDDAGGDPALIEQGPNLVSPGRAPVVHIQNLSQPLRFEGLSDVEPLVPLQDELNTRLSDRASRVTLQSFKMYLAKGIDGFDKAPVRPGTVWQTDNPDASIEAFGGDGASPTEDAHIAQVREAMDKISGVPPLATGVVQAKVGNLTSENALRLTLQGLLAKTQRKRLTYGRGLEEASALILRALHERGVLTTTDAERRVRVRWPDPLPRADGDGDGAGREEGATGDGRQATEE